MIGNRKGTARKTQPPRRLKVAASRRFQLGRKSRAPKRDDRRGGSRQGGPARPGRTFRQKVCHFCKERLEYVDYKDVGLMRKYVSDRGKIRARRVTGNCVKHQKEVATAVKNAREMALLPYVVR